MGVRSFFIITMLSRRQRFLVQFSFKIDSMLVVADSIVKFQSGFNLRFFLIRLWIYFLMYDRAAMSVDNVRGGESW